MDKNHRPVKIAGAGISGLTAAIHLALAGREVIVYERKKEVGGRFYGDLQGLENWTTPLDVLQEFRQFKLSLDFDYQPLPPLLLTDGKQNELPFQFDSPLCYLVKRGPEKGTLDQALKQQAIDLGVQLNLNQSVPLDQADIVATGPKAKEVFAVDKGIRFKTNAPNMAIALVSDQAAYKGYSYLLIIDGYGCMCTVMFHRFNQIGAAYDYTYQVLTNKFDFDIIEPEPVGGLGSFSSKMEFQNKDQRFVGEAAGLQDLLFGFGIRTAVQSGYLAADCLISGLDYENLATKQFENYLKAGIVNRYLFEKFSFFKSAYIQMGKVVQSRGTPINFLRKAYSFTSIHKFVYPIALKSMKKKYPNLKL